MVRSATLVAALLLAGAAHAQSPPPHSAAEHTSKRTPTPHAQKADDPNDISTVPANVQKWMGDAVDNILTGADKALGEGNDKR